MEQLRLIKEIRDDPQLRVSFDALAGEVFGISFQQWHAGGYWTDRFLPYVIADGDKVVAAASANLIDLYWGGTVHPCLQIGTVMTAPGCRKRGLARRLLREILNDWAEQAHLVYLFSRPEASEFYQKLGFVRKEEIRCFASVSRPAAAAKIPLSLDDLSARSLLWAHTIEGNPFAALSGRRCYELLLFHCAHRPGLQLYYLPVWDTVAAVDHTGERTVCLDLFGGSGDLAPLLAALAGQNGELELGFLPKELSLCRLAPLTGADELFVLPGSHVQLPAGPLRMPPLTHT